jgi:hypothetical protein
LEKDVHIELDAFLVALDSPCLVALDTSQEQDNVDEASPEQDSVDEAFQEQGIADDHVEAFPALASASGLLAFERA